MENMKIISKGNIQIPKSLIKNSKLGSNDFLMVVWLKYLMFLGGKDVIEVDIGRLKINMGIEDTRTIKNTLDKLYRVGVVLEEVKLGRKALTKIKINKERMEESPYAQLPVNILKITKDIGGIGARLLFYYESHINRKSGNQFCYTGVRKIVEETGISDKKVKEYNDLLEKKRLLRVVRHQLDEEYDEFNNVKMNRYTNHYYVNVDNLSEI